MIKLFFTLFILTPGLALAADANGPSTAYMIARSTGGLLLVVGLILFLYWVANKKGLSIVKRQARLKVLESTSLGAKKTIAIIQVDDQEIVVGITPSSITHIHTVIPSQKDFLEMIEGKKQSKSETEAKDAA